MTTSVKRSREFDEMFDASDDPWGFRSRWYEARKRDLTLACLPAARYRHAYEPGCANGELAAVLATRCDRLLASDGAAAAVALARQRLQALPHVEVVEAWLPEEWPTAPQDPLSAGNPPGFDLVVFSELGFYLDEPGLADLIARMKASLTPDGTVLACHWRHPVDGHALDGDAVHGALSAQLGMARLLRHEEADFLLEVWSRDPRSVAQREGFI